MAVNFPNSPSLNQTLSQGGITWRWNGYAWNRIPDPGAKGEPGQKGAEGDQGLTGSQGNKGEKGQKGQDGDVEEKGNKGEVGDKGQNYACMQALLQTMVSMDFLVLLFSLLLTEMQSRTMQ